MGSGAIAGLLLLPFTSPNIKASESHKPVSIKYVIFCDIWRTHTHTHPHTHPHTLHITQLSPTFLEMKMYFSHLSFY